MRIDGRNLLYRESWTVWHAEQCKTLKNVLWADDVLNQWCQFHEPLQIVAGEIAASIHQAKKINILVASQLIIINPIEDNNCTDVNCSKELTHGTH